MNQPTHKPVWKETNKTATKEKVKNRKNLALPIIAAGELQSICSSLVSLS